MTATTDILIRQARMRAALTGRPLPAAITGCLFGIANDHVARLELVQRALDTAHQRKRTPADAAAGVLSPLDQTEKETARG